MYKTCRGQVASFTNDFRDLFRAFRNITLQNFRQGFVRLLCRWVAIFDMRSNFCQDARCFCAVFLRYAIRMGFNATIRYDLSARDRWGAIQLFFFSGFFGGRKDSEGGVGLINCTFQDLSDHSIEVCRRQVGTFFTRYFRHL